MTEQSSVVRWTLRALVLIAVTLAVAFGAAMHAQQTPEGGYPANFFHALTWQNIGPQRAGRSIACAGSSARPLEYYSGATGGGLWKTTDGGFTWNPVTDGQIHSSSVGAVAVSASNPDVVWIGMGEKELRGNIMQGDGVYKSTDAGKTWKHMGLEDTETISRIRIDPNNPDVVYVAALGHPAAPNEQRGIFKTTDGGETWKKVLYRDDKTGGVDLSVDSRNPQVIYASLWESWRKSWGMSSGGPGSGLFKSNDAGEHWTEITRNPGLPKGVIGKIGVSVSRWTTIASMRWWKRRMAVCSGRTTRERRGRSSIVRTHCGSARSITRISPPIQWIRISSTAKT